MYISRKKEKEKEVHAVQSSINKIEKSNTSNKKRLKIKNENEKFNDAFASTFIVKQKRGKGNFAI